MSDDNRQVQLSDQDLDLIVYRVRESLRVDRRWVASLLITALVAAAGSIMAARNANRAANSARSSANDAVDGILDVRPYIDGLGASSDEYELII